MCIALENPVYALPLSRSDIRFSGCTVMSGQTSLLRIALVLVAYADEGKNPKQKVVDFVSWGHWGV